jgi:hypothetical protein
MKKVAGIFPPRTGSTFFQTFIPSKKFCGGEIKEKRFFINGIGWVCEQHFNRNNFLGCRHKHIWLVSIREPLEVAKSWYFGFKRRDERISLEDFLLNEKMFFLSYYLNGSVPEEYDGILSIEYPEQSVAIMKNLFKIEKNTKMAKINQSFGEKTISSSVKKEFRDKYFQEYETYELFFESFIKRIEK